MQNEIYCNNCGKSGHLYHHCKLPITSIGIVVFRVNNKIPEFLMIRRKDSLGHIDFMRGKYSLNNKEYIINMLNQMTVTEKQTIKRCKIMRRKKIEEEEVCFLLEFKEIRSYSLG